MHGLSKSLADQLVVIDNAMIPFFRVFLSCVLFRMAPDIVSLKDLRSFLLLKSNSGSDKGYLDYFFLDRLSLLCEPV